MSNAGQSNGKSASASKPRTGAQTQRPARLDDALGPAVIETDRIADRRRSHRETVVTTGTIKCADCRETTMARQVLVTDGSLHRVGIRTHTGLVMGGRAFLADGGGPLYLSSRGRIGCARVG